MKYKKDSRWCKKNKQKKTHNNHIPAPTASLCKEHVERQTQKKRSVSSFHIPLNESAAFSFAVLVKGRVGRVLRVGCL